MENRIFKPRYDKVYLWTLLPTLALLAVGTAFAALDALGLVIMLATDILSLYFFLSPLVGYVELRENTVFIKFGFFLKKEIPYEKIRGFEKKRQFYSESMLALKSAMEHIDIKYNSFDVVSVSVTDNDGLLKELERRVAGAKQTKNNLA